LGHFGDNFGAHFDVPSGGFNAKQAGPGGRVVFQVSHGVTIRRARMSKVASIVVLYRAAERPGFRQWVVRKMTAVRYEHSFEVVRFFDRAGLMKILQMMKALQVWEAYKGWKAKRDSNE
jgi:hypothetical protein